MAVLNQFGRPYDQPGRNGGPRVRVRSNGSSSGSAGEGGHGYSALKEYIDGLKESTNDKAFDVQGAPPNFGQYPIPHVLSFQGLFGTFSHVYRPSDEAIKDSLENARFMRNDPGVMECVEHRQRASSLLDWHLEPEDENSQSQKDLCEELTKILERIPLFMQYRYNLMHAIWYGKYGVQHRFRWVRIGGKMRLIPAKKRDNPGWQPVNGDKLVFRYDDGMPNKIPDQVGIRVGSRFKARDRINGRWNVEPTDRGLAYFLEDWERPLLAIHKHMIEDGAWEVGDEAGMIHGVGIRSRVYWDWFQKQEALAFLMEYLERSAGGIEIWYYPMGNDQAEKSMRTAAEERISNQRNIMLVPKPMGEDAHAYGVDVIEPGMAGINALQEILTSYFGHRIKRYILGQTLSSEAQATGLGSGLAELHLDTFLSIVKFDATNLEETITDQLVRYIKDWNFPKARGINVRFVIETESQAVEEKMNAYQRAWEMGARIKENDVYEAIGTSAPDDSDKVLENPQIAQGGMEGGMPGMGGPEGGPGGGPGGGGPFTGPGPGGFDPSGMAAQVRKNLGIPERDPAAKDMRNELMKAEFGDATPGAALTYVDSEGNWTKREQDWIDDSEEFDTGEREREVSIPTDKLSKNQSLQEWYEEYKKSREASEGQETDLLSRGPVVSQTDSGQYAKPWNEADHPRNPDGKFTQRTYGYRDPHTGELKRFGEADCLQGNARQRLSTIEKIIADGFMSDEQIDSLATPNVTRNCAVDLLREFGLPASAASEVVENTAKAGRHLYVTRSVISAGLDWLDNNSEQKTLYSHLRNELFIERYRVKPAKGQSSLFDDDWDEESHPRDESGKFTEKGKGHAGRKQQQLGFEPGPAHEDEPPGDGSLPGERLPEMAELPSGGDDRDDDDLDPAGGRPESGADGGVEADVPARRERPERDHSKGNWRYPDREFVGGGLKTKFRHNLDAIKALRTIESEGRSFATAEEQEALAKFSGWGQFPQLFKAYPDDNWKKEQAELKSVLSDREFDDAKESSGAKDYSYQEAKKATLNSHFTSPQIVDAHWRIAQKLGFNGGRYLEPSVGSGYYIGMMPPEIAKRTSVTGVELDRTTSEIADKLYPSASIKHQGFETYQAPDNFYDLVASNVPFGDYTLHERRYNKFRAPIHDHFFLKSVDKARPGGLVMHVTSTGTMDKSDSRIRRELASKADLVSAIRLPGSTHGAAAGTEVVTDMVILRKHGPAGAAPEETPDDVQSKAAEEPGFTGVLTDSLGRVYHFVDGKRVPGDHWLETTTVDDPEGGDPIEVNSYFANHPDQILGTLDRSGTMYGPGQKNVTPPEDFDAALEAAIGRIPEGLYEEATERTDQFEADAQPAPDDIREGNYIVKDGDLYQMSDGMLAKRSGMSKADQSRIAAAVAIRGPLRELIRKDLAGETSDDEREKLNEAYDRFFEEHGALHERANIKALHDDPDMPLLMSLEKWDPKAKTAEKADIFSQPTIRPNDAPTTAETASEAMGITLNQSGTVDVGEMSKLTGIPVSEIEDELRESGIAFEDPENGWTDRSTYLSGNVREKLELAKAAAENDDRFSVNVTALEAAQPPDIDYEDISTKLGTPWVPNDDMNSFAAHMMNTDADQFAIQYSPELGTWQVDYSKEYRPYKIGHAAESTWSTPHTNARKLLESAMNNKTPKVYEYDAEGNRQLDVKATEENMEKIQQMRDEFADWIWDDQDRRERLHRFYNDNFNNIVPQQYDGSHLTFPGMLPSWNLRKTASDFAWQAITRGRGILAHEVGVGKTAAMVASAMELRRLGLSKKPAIVALKANLEQLTQEAQELYPGARILSTAGQFTAQKRKETVSRMASGDYDMVIMSHDHLNMLPMDGDVQARFIQEELDDLEAAIGASKEIDDSKNNRTVKQLEKRKAQLEKKIKDALDSKKDDAITFEQTGIDQLFVDEAHAYKNLPVYTTMGQVAGVPTATSQRAMNMLMRTKWLQEQNNGRGVVFATGTPISNTMAEAYNLQRYIQPDELQARGINNFDAWANTFGEMETSLEPDLKGGYKEKTRFSRFNNVPELMQILRQDMDVKRVDNLRNEDGSPMVPRPDRVDHVVISPENDLTKEMMSSIHSRAQEVQGKRPEKGEDNVLSITTDGRQGSVDARLYGGGFSAEDHPDSKVNMMVRNVLDRYHNPETSGQSQLIFSDIGVNPNKQTGFHLYQDVVDKLVEGGIPRDEIADFGALKDKKAARLKAAEGLNSGKVKIGIGGTQTMGTGLNVQKHIGAMHHLDIPYVPTALEQRDGRGHRFGNSNSEVNVYRYVNEGSLDEMSWGIVSRKQSFINQAVTDPTAGQRSLSEEDAEVLTPQQLMAAASGDTRILDRVNLQHTLKKLRRSKVRHDRDQEQLQARIAQTENEIKMADKQASKVSQDAEHLERNPEFRMKIGGRTYTERKEAQEALQSEAKARAEREADKPWYRQSTGQEHEVGEYRGMPLSFVNGRYRLTGPSGETYQTGESVKSLDYVARNIPKQPDKIRSEQEKMRSDLESIRKQVGKPFSRMDQLQKTEEELKRIEQELKGGDSSGETEKHSRLMVSEFNRRFAEKYRQPGPEWVTIGGSAQGDKKHVGGTPVKLDDEGNILAGPRSLKGQDVDELGQKPSGPEWFDEMRSRDRVNRFKDASEDELRSALDRGEYVPARILSQHPDLLEEIRSKQMDEKRQARSDRRQQQQEEARRARGKQPDEPPETAPAPQEGEESQSDSADEPPPPPSWFRGGRSRSQFLNQRGKQQNIEFPPVEETPEDKYRGVVRKPDGRYVGAAQVSKEDLNVDPHRFQYKISDIDPKTGVTKELQEVGTFRPEFAGQLLVWNDPETNEAYVVNGHHRYELAHRLGYDGDLSVFFLDAKDATEARSIGALANMAEGRGTAVDAAKFMRDNEKTADDLKKEGISLKGRVADDGTTLSKLSDAIFHKVATQQISENRGLAIARELGDHDAQNKLFDYINNREKSGRRIPDKVVREMAREMAQTPNRSIREQSLFGEEDREESLFLERNQLKTFLRSKLAEQARAFKAVASEQRRGTLEGTGRNVIDTEANREAAQQAREGLFDFDREVNFTGPLSDAVNAAAEEMANDPRSKKRIQSELLGNVRRIIGGEGRPPEPGAMGTDDGGSAGDAGARGTGETPGVERDRITPAAGQKGMFRRQGLVEQFNRAFAGRFRSN